MSENVETEWLVVGAGSAGCVVASRLSEDPGTDVVLLEAGPDWRSADAPAEVRSMNFWRALDPATCGHLMWEGLSSRRTPVQAFSPHLRGRGMGGSSAINGMIAIRAMPDDYDRWAAAGCPGWSYDDVLPSLRRMEDDADFGDRPYHGDAGPIPVMRQPRERWGAVDGSLADAALALGYPWADDHNAPGSTGVSPFAINVRDMQRVSTNDGYIEPIRSRPNLRIIGDATVDRVLIEAGRARGVRVRIDGDWVDVHAERVVLCAGAIHSPSILLRSGIGPQGDVAVLPVGESLQDHPLALFWLTLRPDAWADIDDRQTNCIVRYSSGLDGGVENDMAFISQNLTQDTGHRRHRGARRRRPTGTWGIGRGGGGRGRGLLCVQLNHEQSRGSLRLASPDPDQPPVINSNLLHERSDRVRLRDGIHRALELLAQPAFAASVEHVAIDHEGRGVDALGDDAAIDDWLMRMVGDAAHICGTSRMGSVDDARSVVDPRGVSSASTACTSPMPPSSRRSRERTRTCRSSPPPNAWPNCFGLAPTTQPDHLIVPSIQVKDVPADVHSTLRRRAAAAGQSIARSILARLVQDALDANC